MTTTFELGSSTGFLAPDFEVVVRGYDRKAVRSRIATLKRERIALDRRATQLEEMLAAGPTELAAPEVADLQTTGLGRRIEALLREACDEADRCREDSADRHREAVAAAREAAIDAVEKSNQQARLAAAAAELEGNRLIEIARRDAERLGTESALKAARVRAQEAVVLDSVRARVEQLWVDCEAELGYASSQLDRDLEAKAVAGRNRVELATLQAQAMREEAVQMSERARRQADSLLESGREEARRLLAGAAEGAERLRLETQAAVGAVQTAMEELGAVLDYQRSTLPAQPNL